MSLLALNPAVSIYGGNNANTATSTVADGTAQRLMVQSAPAGGVSPIAQPWAVSPMAQTVWAPLTNGNNTNMLVNGTPTSPVLFTYPNANNPLPASGVMASMLKLVYSVKSMGFTGNQITSTTGLLGLGVNAQYLPNGLLLGGTFGGVSTVLAKITINEDLFSLNGPPPVLTAGDSGKVLVATLVFAQPIAANGTDKVQVTVQDFMAGITTANTLKAFVGGVQMAA